MDPEWFFSPDANKACILSASIGGIYWENKKNFAYSTSVEDTLAMKQELFYRYGQVICILLLKFNEFAYKYV